MRYNPPPNWPQPPAGWTPPAGWQPDPEWGPAPDGWEVFVKEAGDAIWEATGRPMTGLGAGKYKLTDKYLFFEKGGLRTDSQQVPIAQVLDVDVKQSMTQKARGVGNMVVHIQRTQGVELVTLEDIPNFREGQRLINETAHAAKLAEERRRNTTIYEGMPQQQFQQPQYAPPPPVPAPVQTPVPSAMDELMAQLAKLGELNQAGVLTDEEFAAKKADILGRL
jgi:hypothetical protein